MNDLAERQNQYEDAARDKAKLDFLGVSSHSHMITDDGYANLKRAAKEFTKPGFVALVAQECVLDREGVQVERGGDLRELLVGGVVDPDPLEVTDPARHAGVPQAGVPVAEGDPHALVVQRVVDDHLVRLVPLGSRPWQRNS